MAALVLFYSFSGHTKQLAERIAAERGADIEQVYEVKKRGVFSAYFSGAPKAMRQETVEIKPLTADLNAYDTLVIAAPIWAGYPAPAFNSIVKLLPTGRQVELVFTSGSGKDKCGATARQAVKGAGCEVVSFRNVRNAKN